MVGPQDTYEAGPNGNEVLAPNPGTNILTTNHMYMFIYGLSINIVCMYTSKELYILYLGLA